MIPAALEDAARTLSEFGGPSHFDILGDPRVRRRATRQAFALTHPFRLGGNRERFALVLAASDVLQAEAQG